MAEVIGAEHMFIEQTFVFPATTRRTTTSLPLTFLDLPFAGPKYVKRQFFYRFPHQTNHFYQTTLPSLKHSLSLTLQHFFPLLGNLHCPPPPQKPFILCTQNDALTLTVIESSGDFNNLSTNHHPKSLKDFSHLVPKLTQKIDLEDNDTLIFSLMALQVSFFPNHGLCISITYCHVMDDYFCNYFMKSWSFIHKKGKLVDMKSLPCFDRQVLRDPKDLEQVLLKGYFEQRKMWKNIILAESQTIEKEHQDYVKTTISFTKEEIEGMKNWILKKWKTTYHDIQAPKFLSKFVVTCGFVWATMVKTKNRNNDDAGDEKDEYFCFVGDCRDRLGYPIPEGYFGNCLTLCFVAVKRKDVKGEYGFLNVVKAIQNAITEMKNDPLKDAEKWDDMFKKVFMSGNHLLVSGSPNFNVYETNFEFGNPIKVDMMMHSSKDMSLAESGDKEGGLEVGLIFKTEELEQFYSFMEQGLKALKF
ncbi:malonyl-coenzyme A:anthocyanin 3-O-glucoside-6''-O-malonyltransferase-like [Vicia villosa]|uniref:malonyl-coenzyme A:anthocyanin 3-O-glucoside-6''-O-malonyltransferase-like n=1 Tax=Vicia villosa TaxID=3911 RepID=UPI00273B0CBA|nr:malonyl-coenzyme A:anthocyanin 3-O-glucoside-6''-O-malonyltransferase-like [Vicia villosa]